jgi:putative Mg2+ transporter-C (MgtC) family protein
MKMDLMPLALDWPDVALRLFCALVAGAAFGLNRTESGKVAGLRTTLLVCLAACLSMLEVNALLPLAGKASNSFIQLDLMRLPLGVLTGMGFIGAGAVLRKDGLVTGVTTAATLWFVTIVGLCVGAGLLRLAASGVVLGVGVLWGLRVVEERLKRNKRAWLVVEYMADSDCPRLLGEAFNRIGCSLTRRGAYWKAAEGVFEERLLVRWEEPFNSDVKATAFAELARRTGAESAHWSMID